MGKRTPAETKAAWRSSGYKGGFKKDGPPTDKIAAAHASNAAVERQMNRPGVFRSKKR